MVPFDRDGCDEHVGEVFCARGAPVLLLFLAGVASAAEVDVEEDCVVLGIQIKVGQRQGGALEWIEGNGSAERLGGVLASPDFTVLVADGSDDCERPGGGGAGISVRMREDGRGGLIGPTMASNRGLNAGD